MASETLEVIISAKDQFSATADRVIGKLGKMESSAGRVGKGMGQVAGGLARVGAIAATAAAAGLVGIAKLALSWEDAMAGVNKTMDLTPKQLEDIGTEIRKLSTTIPVAATEIAGLAEAAGALGIAKEDVVDFARVTATLGATTNVSADAAADALGGFATVLGLTGKSAGKTTSDFERFGSALVDLGNKGASTEAEIVAIAQKMAGTGAVIGLSTDEILGWSAAMANAKLEPQAAASAFSKLGIEMISVTGKGGKALDEWGAVAGMTGKEFKKAFEEDASGGLQSFVTGLSKMGKNEQVNVLDNLGLSDIRMRRMLLTLAESEKKTSNLSQSLTTSAKAWQANTAMAEEADKKYSTVGSKLKLLKAQLMEGAMLIGEGFLPALGRMADKLKDALGSEDVRADLKKLGEDIGKFLDGIDWKGVVKGAKEFVGILKEAAGWAKTAFDAVNKLPGEVKAIGLSFLAADKLSGGLLSKGVGNIVGGVASGLGAAVSRGAASRLPVVGKLFAQPVIVTNWPAGGLGGGGIGKGVGAAGAGAAGSGAAAAGGGFMAAGLAPLAAMVAAPIIMAIGIPKLASMREGFKPEAGVGAGSEKDTTQLLKRWEQSYLSPTLLALQKTDTNTSATTKKIVDMDRGSSASARAVLAATRTASDADKAGNVAMQRELSGAAGAARNTTIAARATAQAIRDKQWRINVKVPVSVTTRVSVRDSRVATITSGRYAGKSIPID